MQIINIGFGNLVFADRIIGIIAPDSSPVKRLIRDATERGKLVDASFGRKTQSVIVTDSDHIILSALTPETLQAKINGEDSGNETDR